MTMSNVMRMRLSRLLQLSARCDSEPVGVRCMNISLQPPHIIYLEFLCNLSLFHIAYLNFIYETY